MNTLKKLIFLLLITSGIVISCKDEPTPGSGDSEAPQLTQDINRFIQTVMEDVYLWYRELPDVDIRYEFDPLAYFDKLLYTEDKWSFVTDDIQELEDSFEGKEKSYGWSLAYGYFTGSESIYALVEFVYPNTPAALAGVKRGDMIYEIDGSDIAIDNYTDLLYADNINFTFGQYLIGSGITNSKTKSLTAMELTLDPVQFTNVIEHGGKKIGYIFYAQFIDDFNSSLDTVFQHFLDEQVSDVVLDLRYNPGGTTLAAQYLCSSLAPVNDVTSGKVLVNFQWNDKYQDHWEKTNAMVNLRLLFLNSVAYKMGYNKIHVLTGQGTASASELLITGLRPYMDVVTVGDSTFGKYTASITIKPEDYYDTPSDYSDFDNWGVQPIILRYANSQGVTDFKNGFGPDISVEDDLISPIPLGDKTEAVLKAAIEDITGVEVIAMKSAEMKPHFRIFDRGFSRFDANKREVLYNHEAKSFPLKK